MQKLTIIARNFCLKGEIKEIKPFGGGLINSTYQIITDSNKYLFQKINHAIFTNIAELTTNIERITKHIRAKFENAGVKDISRKTLTIIYTKDQKGFYKDEKGNSWRVFDFIENSKTYDKIVTPEQAVATGVAFAEFQKTLSDLDNPPLYEVLEDFHNTAMHIDTFLETLEKDAVGRRVGVEEEVSFLLKRKEEMRKIVEQGEKGELPLRTVHQDAKLNNILFDKNTNEILCVIDLDTTMPGYVCYDFGDAIRTGACTANEDEKDLTKVDFDFDIFKNFAEGYVTRAKKILTKNELESLAFGAKLLAYEQAVRFLNDYLQGDTYYKTEYSEHNLVRTRTQIKLLMKMEEKYNQMQTYIEGLLKSSSFLNWYYARTSENTL